MTVTFTTPEVVSIVERMTRDGWTTEAAVAHVEQSCDRAVCTGEHADDHHTSRIVRHSRVFRTPTFQVHCVECYWTFEADTAEEIEREHIEFVIRGEDYYADDDD